MAADPVGGSRIAAGVVRLKAPNPGTCFSVFILGVFLVIPISESLIGTVLFRVVLRVCFCGGILCIRVRVFRCRRGLRFRAMLYSCGFAVVQRVLMCYGFTVARVLVYVICTDGAGVIVTVFAVVADSEEGWILDTRLLPVLMV